jgi:hypothetical protein
MAALTGNSGRSLANLRPFPPGTSGNPKGRPAGIAAYARRQTKNGKELVDFMLNVLRRSGEFEHARVPLPVRMEAATWLADQAFGKPVQRNEHTGADGGPMQLDVREVVIQMPAAVEAAVEREADG